MKKFLWIIASLSVPSLAGAAKPDPLKDWPAWRGPTHNGIAAPDQSPPIKWSESENILWKTAIPGRGHASPTLVANRIYLPTAEASQEEQSILCLDSLQGKILWQTTVHKGKWVQGGHQRASLASSSIACDGNSLFINFLNDDAIYTSSLNLAGEIQWQTRVSSFQVHQGFASSPFLHENLVIVSTDNKAGGCIAALDASNGEVVWKHERPQEPNYTSPVVYHLAGRDQLLLSGCNLLTSLDPLTGEIIWETAGSTTECVVTMVTDGLRVFSGGGYPKNHTLAIRADGSKTLEWQNSSRVYVPSMLVKEGHLFAVLDAGFAACWKSDTGEELWKERLGGDFFSSPVLVNDLIYATNVGGKTYVFKAITTGLDLIATNQLGNETYSSPAICDGKIYLRTAHVDDLRQEFLYCISQP